MITETKVLPRYAKFLNAAVATDDSRQNLLAVHTAKIGSSMFFAGVDGHRLHVLRAPDDFKEGYVSVSSKTGLIEAIDRGGLFPKASAVIPEGSPNKTVALKVALYNEFAKSRSADHVLVMDLDNLDSPLIIRSFWHYKKQVAGKNDVGFNPWYIRAALRSVAAEKKVYAEEVFLDFYDHYKAVRIRPAKQESADWLAFVMPMCITGQS